MKSSVLSAAIAAGILAVPSLASAQDQVWLKDRRYTEGPGYRVGDFELHPGAALEFGYDSNYLRLTTDPVPSLRLRVTPSLSFTTLGAERQENAPSASRPSIIFRGGLSATYNEFIPITSGSTISGERNVGANVDLGLGILPGRTWSGNLTASYGRVLTASAEGNGPDGPPSSGFNSQGTLNRDIPSAGAEIAFAPGAGLLEWRLGYQFTGSFFEDSTFSTLNSFANQVETRGRWRFLPRTSLIFDGKFGFNIFPNNTGAVYEKFNSHPVRALLGVNGLVTSSFAVLAMVGWGSSFYQLPAGANANPVQDFDSAIGQVEVKWFITPNQTTEAGQQNSAPFLSSIAIGFTRDFVDSYIGSTYFEQDRGYAQLSYMYAGKFLVVVGGGAGPVLYPTLTQTFAVPMPMVAPITAFTDIRIDGSVFAEYRFRDNFGLNATFRYNQNIDNGHVPLVGGAELAFQEIEAYLGVRWLM
jgi:hypothetical protein